MKSTIALIPILLASGITMAGPTLVTSPYLPYPPGCVRMPDPQAPGGLDSQAVKFYEGEFRVYDLRSRALIPVNLRAFRAPCSERNRSLIWLELVLDSQFVSMPVEIPLPTVVAESARGWREPLNLTFEPDGLGSGGWRDREGTFLLSQVKSAPWYHDSPNGNRKWVFLLENQPPFPELGFGSGLTPSEYNRSFKLEFYGVYESLTIDVPATRDLLPAPPPGMALSGRLSGNWVIPDAKDQGLLLSISERVLPDTPGVPSSAELPMVIFLAHYTFDTHGDMLWLTGTAEFSPGTHKVTIPMVKVSNGQFRGNRAAHREVIGEVTLRSFSCNNLRFRYDYELLGLGSGTRKLQRLFSLETAGFDCRDHEAKVAANQKEG